MFGFFSSVFLLPIFSNFHGLFATSYSLHAYLHTPYLLRLLQFGNIQFFVQSSFTFRGRVGFMNESMYSLCKRQSNWKLNVLCSPGFFSSNFLVYSSLHQFIYEIRYLHLQCSMFDRRIQFIKMLRISLHRFAWSVFLLG